MNAADTSIEAFDQVKASGRSEEVQEKIVEFMRKWRGPLTRQDLAHYLDEPINVICPRVLELLEAKRLVVTGDIRTDHNGMKCRRRDLLMLPSEQYQLFGRSDRPGAIQEARV